MKEVSLKEHIQEISMGPFGSNIKIDNFISLGIPVLNGSNLTSHKLVEDGFKYVTEEKANSLGKANAKRGDIVITHRGTLGQVAYIPFDSKFERYVISQSQFRVKFKDSINPIYFAYLMLSKYGQKKLLSFKNHVGVPALAQATTNFKLLELFIPDIITQNKIASILSALDDKIELNNKINAELETMAKTLYDYWFVQFDFPNADGKPYKASGGEMVYNEVLKREIPKGWEVKSLDKIIAVKDGTHDSPKYVEDGFHLVTSKNLKRSGIDFNETNKISELDFKSINLRSKVDTGDILFSMIGSIGVIYKVEEIKIDFAIKNVALFKTSQKEHLKNYIYQYLHSYDMQRYVPNVISGSIQKFIGLTSLRQTPVLFNEILIALFDEKTKEVFNKIEINIKQNQELASLRDWLLPMLMNGQVTVNDTYDIVEEELGMVAEGEVKFGGKQ
jgi:type I restriction enzyme S subunit